MQENEIIDQAVKDILKYRELSKRIAQECKKEKSIVDWTSLEQIIRDILSSSIKPDRLKLLLINEAIGAWTKRSIEIVP